MEYKTILNETLEELEKARINDEDYYIENAKIEYLLDYIKTLNSLIQTQRSHIDTQVRIFKNIQDTLKLCVVTKEQPVDIQEQQTIIKELIEWLDLLLKENK